MIDEQDPGASPAWEEQEPVTASGAGRAREDGSIVEHEAIPEHDPAATREPRTDPAALAREAMERARASAKERGAYRTSPQAARRQSKSKRAATDADFSPQPFGMGRDPRPMGENVEALLRRMGWTEHIEVASVTARWREVIGDQIADHCEPVSFEDGALLLRASSSAWATQMQLMSGQVRHRLNEEFGREVVKELRFVGPSDKTWVKGPRRVKGRGPRDTYG